MQPLLLTAVAILAYVILFSAGNWAIHRGYGIFNNDVFYMRALFRLYVTLATGFCIGWIAQPIAASAIDALQARLSARSRQVVLAASLGLTCVLTSILLIHFGRLQYGSWDFGILTDVGWRQIVGQQPYVDFATPTPPFFNWTAALAFRTFGVNWNANLYLSALFASGTLLWSFLLFRQLGMRAFASLAVAFIMQAAAMLTGSFWWYNNTTLVLAALFYLASMLLALAPASRLAQVSFVVLLAAMPLTKPNIAGATVCGCILLLLLGSEKPARILALIAIGFASAYLLFIAFRVSLPAMLATYRGIAKERGGLSAFGFISMQPGERYLTLCWMPVLCVPLVTCLGPFRSQVVQSHWKRAAFWLFFPLAAVVAALGIAGNGELRDVECTLLIAAMALLAFVFRKDATLMQRLTVALLCAMLASDLYTGAARLRVYTIAKHGFFEWRDNRHLFTSGFLKDLRGSETLVEVNQEIKQTVDSTTGPYFFGPRLDFEYAVLGIAPPMHWVTFFQPGTSFDSGQTETFVKIWADHRFNTLVFLKDDYVFYPLSLTEEIKAAYIRDDRYPRLTVYHRRPGV